MLLAIAQYGTLHVAMVSLSAWRCLCRSSFFSGTCSKGAFGVGSCPAHRLLVALTYPCAMLVLRGFARAHHLSCGFANRRRD